MTTENDTPSVGGLHSQVKPTFMVPAVGMSVFGGLLSTSLSLFTAVVHALAVGAALYTAHVVDEYVDAYVRAEEPPLLSIREAQFGFAVASAVCLSLAGVLAFDGRFSSAGSVVALWVLAVLHAPLLDKNTIAVTLDYPVGIALALVGGYLAQQQSLGSGVVALAVLFVVMLAGVKVSLDRLDLDFDERIDKHTVPVVFGKRRAMAVSSGFFLVAGGLVAMFVSQSILPQLALASVPILFGGGVVAFGSVAERVVVRQMVFVYPISVVLFLSQCLATKCTVEPIISWLL
ncbi:UbiA family prenyltransferase [Haloferax sp. DFSO60]|uniref:UbiA family prenyltransferase n=1 Tax=Haloferax sp. DFSO60 TaxID=3388652 RepID=UPI0039791305